MNIGASSPQAKNHKISPAALPEPGTEAGHGAHGQSREPSQKPIVYGPERGMSRYVCVIGRADKGGGRGEGPTGIDLPAAHKYQPLAIVLVLGGMTKYSRIKLLTSLSVRGLLASARRLVAE